MPINFESDSKTSDYSIRAPTFFPGVKVAGIVIQPFTLAIEG